MKVRQQFLYFIFICPIALSMCSSTNETSSPTRLPIDLKDIGYNGTWESFCDVDEILNDFPVWPHHDLRRLRIRICKLKKDGKVNRDALPAFVGYKWCNSIRTSLDYFFDELTKRFASFDDDKKSEMLSDEGKNADSPCYNETIKSFTEKCMGPEHICSRMFKDLLARACLMSWLTTETMIAHINDVCDGKWMSDYVDWDTLFPSIKYNE